MGLDDTASLPRPQCPNCDYISVPGARFCSNCGARLDATAVEGATHSLPTVGSEEALSGPIPVVAMSPETGAILLVIKGPDAGAEFQLSGDVVLVGRSPDSDVFLDDVTVSRNHAELLHGSEGWLVRDKGSLNGTYVNRILVDEQRLSQGDEVQIGKYRFQFWAAE